jgi:hypothetical protein
MNYKKTNLAVLQPQKGPSTELKGHKLHKYLLDNNIAYFYLTKKNEHLKSDNKILAKGEALNRRYVKTLLLIDKISKENKIDCLLFKTHKYIEDVVDGDIDLIIKKGQLQKFIRKIEKSGFKCIQEEKFKYSCTKSGFSKIEPRVNVSYHGLMVIESKTVWSNTDYIQVKNRKIRKTLFEIDLVAQLLNVLYGPNYLKLYLYKISQRANFDVVENLVNNSVKEDIRLVKRELLQKKNLEKRFPIFLSNYSYMNWWREKILLSTKVKLLDKIRHIVFFYYIKYKYTFFSKTHFKHEW